MTIMGRLFTEYATMCREHEVFVVAAQSLMPTAGGLTARALEKPRAGTAASEKAMERRRLRYGDSGLDNATKIKMRQQGQEVGD